MLRLLFILLLTACAVATAQAPQAGTITGLAYTPQSENRLFFTGSYQGQPVNMVRGTHQGQGYWHIYTGAPTQRVRMTIDDRSGLRDILALDSGLRITVRQVLDERTEYRLYAANQRFLSGAVLFRKEGRWWQGLMTTASFQGYGALTQLSDISDQLSRAAAADRAAKGGLAQHLQRYWGQLALLPTARADDNLLRGFFSDSASDAREFFAAPGHEMFKAMLVGAAAFTVKLVQVSIGDGALVAAGAAAAPFIAAVGAGVVIGLAAERVDNWLRTKQLRGTTSATELFQRLTAPTQYTRQAEPVAPPPFSAALAPPPSRTSVASTTASQGMPAPPMPAINAARATAPAPPAPASPANPPAAVTAGATAARTRSNDPALNGSFSNSEEPENKLVYAFNGSELTISRNACAVKYRYSTMVIAGTNYLTYTALSDQPPGCGGPMGTEFSRTYKVNGASLLIESSRERAVALLRGG